MQIARPQADLKISYLYWALALYACTIAASVGAPLFTSLIWPETSSWHLQKAMRLRGVELGRTAELIFMGHAFFVVSWAPALLSLFLIGLSKMPVIFHSLVGAAVFGVVVGGAAQSLQVGVFSAIFGAISVGGTAALVALRRHLASEEKVTGAA
ncbi:MAG: hypothetical protein M3N39_05370 [Pseudomonadota bacterium]|nr:hypothetical protein [Pseudomonadota bacterium]